LVNEINELKTKLDTYLKEIKEIKELTTELESFHNLGINWNR